jgi:hypothetical protein
LRTTLPYHRDKHSAAGSKIIAELIDSQELHCRGAEIQKETADERGSGRFETGVIFVELIDSQVLHCVARRRDEVNRRRTCHS